MAKLLRFVYGLILSAFLGISVFSQSHLTVRQIVEKNLSAAGGGVKISLIHHYSFQAGDTTYHVSGTGVLKTEKGQRPVVTEILLVSGDRVERNCFNKRTEIENPEKSYYQVLARLFSGLFTVIRFQEGLTYNGLKVFGLEKFHWLTSAFGPVHLEFYIHPDDFLLKRLVIAYHDANGKNELNYDFGQYREMEGIQIPESWFVSSIGSRGILHEPRNIAFNSSLGEDFFTSLDLNIGKVDIRQNSLLGHLVGVNIRRSDFLILATNWTQDCFDRSGLKKGDRVEIKLESQTAVLTLMDSPLSRDGLVPGLKALAPNPRDGNYLIYILSSEFSTIVEKLKILSPVEIKKIDKEGD